MGPLASAEFLKTIYEACEEGSEQRSPVVMMYSDPTFPDRTTAFLRGEEETVLDQLVEALEGLAGFGAQQIVLCCVTIHHLLPRLPARLRERTISLLDVIYSNLEASGKRHLLLCSNGTRRFELFENHEGWARMRGRILLPAEQDQRMIHRDLIYPMKRAPNWAELVPMLDALLAKYEVDSFIAGCSEVHMLAKQAAVYGKGRKSYSCIDPFAILAKEWAKECI
jgi:aspartate racemase